jgi:Flp pilus assembly protein TadG
MKQGFKSGLWSDKSGATAVEFAIIAPVFLAIIFGIIQLSFLALTVASLNYSVEKGARCAALSSESNCPADSYYFAPGALPAFTYGTTACGTSLTAQITYNLNVIIYRASIPLRASACFP